MEDVAENIVDRRDAAENAALSYVTDDGPRIRRRKAGKKWGYRNPDGSHISDRAVIERIKALAIPPAYADVWICPDPKGHLQVRRCRFSGQEAKLSPT